MDLGIKEFFHDMADLFTGKHSPEEHTTYNSSQVGAGLMAVKQHLEESPEITLTNDALDTLFAQIQLTDAMSKSDITQALAHIADITDLPASVITNTTIGAVENDDFNVNLMRSVRFGQLQEKYQRLNFDDLTIDMDDGNIPH